MGPSTFEQPINFQQRIAAEIISNLANYLKQILSVLSLNRPSMMHHQRIHYQKGAKEAFCKRLTDYFDDWLIY